MLSLVSLFLELEVTVLSGSAGQCWLQRAMASVSGVGMAAVSFSEAGTLVAPGPGVGMAVAFSSGEARRDGLSTSKQVGLSWRRFSGTECYYLPGSRGGGCASGSAVAHAGICASIGAAT